MHTKYADYADNAKNTNNAENTDGKIVSKEIKVIIENKTEEIKCENLECKLIIPNLIELNHYNVDYEILNLLSNKNLDVNTKSTIINFI